jgi:hypothetical protein
VASIISGSANKCWLTGIHGQPGVCSMKPTGYACLEEWPPSKMRGQIVRYEVHKCVPMYWCQNECLEI